MPRGDAIVVCPEPLAAEAGGRVLRGGGNAVDAVIAAAYTQGLVNPLMCGIGGTGHILVHASETGESVMANFGSRAGSLAHERVYPDIEPTVFANRFRARDWANYVGYQSITIPSFVRGTWDTHQRFGRLAWDALLEPAIEAAQDGVTIDEFTFSFWDPQRVRHGDSPDPRVTLTATEECARIYLKDDGSVYGIGERLYQPDYGRTLRRIAAEGAGVFYEGEIGRAIADDFEANGALVTREDLRSYRTPFEPPVSGSFHGMEVLTERSPSMGSLEIEALHILQELDLVGAGWRSPRYYDTLARVFQVIYADRARWNGDPRFVDVPVASFHSRERAKELAAEIVRGQRSASGADAGGSGYTTHVSAVDRWGNAASFTHSNGNSAGVVTPGLGFLHNHHMHNFDPRPGQNDSVAAGKSPLYGCSPLMLMREGAPEVVSGSKSRYRVTAELQVLVDLFTFEASLEEAIEHPRIHAEYAPDKLYLEPAIPRDMHREFERLGWECIVVNMAVPMCTILRHRDGCWEAVADPRGGGGLVTC
jgi:gamma-glutamyltranspeptidase / glutathione hydrolase